MFASRRWCLGFFMLFLLACGQKGDLYLSKQSSQPEKSLSADKALFSSSPASEVLPDLLWIKATPVVGSFVQINELNSLGWQAVLSTETGSKERYFIPTSRFLQNKRPLMLLVGRLARPSPTTSAATEKLSQQTLPAGYYLRFSSLDNSAQELLKLLTSVRQYFQQNPEIKPRESADFFIDNQEIIDLYIAVEKTN